MTTEELLKPRWKVIADYPDAILNVGDIFTTYDNGVAYVTETSKCDVREFPYLFKKLEWWEERKIEDMPKYVKVPYFPNGEKDFEIYLVDGTNIRHDFTPIGYFGLKFKDGGGKIYSEFEPATEEKYLTYINKKQP